MNYVSEAELLILPPLRPPESWPGGHIGGIRRCNLLDSMPGKLEGASGF
jgi:hypothetical protein